MSLERLPPPSLPAWLDRLVPFERFRVRVEDRHLHVMVAGPEGAPPVLLLHGNPTWGFLWRKVATELLREPGGPPLRLVMPDLVGLGFSDKPRQPAVHTLESHARWLGGLIDGLIVAGGPERLVFVGHDWGGPIGLRALADRPERLAGLVLLNTVASPPKPGFEPTAFHRFARTPVVSTAAFRLLGYPQRALHLAQGDRSSIRGEVARAYRGPGADGAGLLRPRLDPGPLALPQAGPGLRRTSRGLLRVNLRARALSP